MDKPAEPNITPEDARIAGDLLADLARKMRDDATTIGDHRRAEGIAGVATYLLGCASAFAAAPITPSQASERMTVVATAQALHRGRTHEDALALALGVLMWLANTSPQPGPTTSQILGVLIGSLELARSKCPAPTARASA